MIAKGSKRLSQYFSMLICSFNGTKLKLQLNCRNVCSQIRKFCKHIVLSTFRNWMFCISKACQHTCSDFDLCFIVWQEKQGFSFDLAQAFKCFSLALVVANYTAILSFKCSFCKLFIVNKGIPDLRDLQSIKNYCSCFINSFYFQCASDCDI